MSEQQGLWYEISLTNRQVLAAFLILLACIVGAFLSGVWVGREAMAGEGPLLTVDAGQPESGDAFQFFGEEGDAAASSGAPIEPVASSTPPVTVRRPEKEPEKEPVKQRAARAEKPTPEESPVESEPAPELSPDDLIIQVFSSADQSQARTVLSRLKNGGFQAFLSPVAVDGRTMFRVRVGPFDERAEAEKIAARVKREQRLDTWITSASN